MMTSMCIIHGYSLSPMQPHANPPFAVTRQSWDSAFSEGTREGVERGDYEGRANGKKRERKTGGQRKKRKGKTTRAEKNKRCTALQTKEQRESNLSRATAT